MSQAALKDISMASVRAMQSGDQILAFRLAVDGLQDARAGHMQHLAFGEVMTNIKITEFSPRIKKAVLSYLGSAMVDHRKAIVLWLSMLSCDPALKPFWDCINKVDFKPEDWDACEPILNDPFITEGLRKLIIPHDGIEWFLRALRRHALLELYPAGELKTKNLPFLCALAEQCFFNEYVYKTSAEEDSAVKDLPLDDPIAVAIRGAYQSLSEVDVNPKLSAVAGFRQLVKTQIFEPAYEQKLRETITSLEDITDTVSKNVREMYEENPYPRWRNVDLPMRSYSDVTGSMLIAGCGTGRTTTQMGFLFPNMDVTAIDISKRSLAYAMRSGEDKGAATRVNFYQGDIMNLSNMGKTFDFVECSGVLHHMADPVAGWKKLIERLAPGGRMLICLYSTKARADVKQVRAHIAEKGLAPIAENIRNLRSEIMEDKEHPLRPIMYSRDFYTLSETRDLVFHIQETTYTLPELAKIIDDIGLEFLRFKMPNQGAQKLYAERFPDDPAMTSFENWDKFEDEFPHTFNGMFKMILKRKGDEIVNDAAQTMMAAAYSN